MREIFTDGFNSISHFSFGVASAYFDSMILFSGFFIYEFAHNGVCPDCDSIVCIMEFLIGYIMTKLAKYFLKYKY